MNQKGISTHGVILIVLILFATRILVSSSYASDQVPAAPQDHPIALLGGTIHPVSSPAIEGGVVLFNDGKITALGVDVQLPSVSYVQPKEKSLPRSVL